MQSFVLGILFLLPSGNENTQFPDVLERAIKSRTNFKTMHATVRIVDRQFTTWTRIQNLEIKTAGPNLLILNKGDDDGIVAKGLEGIPLLGMKGACLPVGFVIEHDNDERVWIHGDNDDLVTLTSTSGLEFPPDLFNPLIFGLEANWPWGKDTPQSFLEVLKKRQCVWRIQVDGNISTVSSIKEGDDFQLIDRWVIDKSKDFAILETRRTGENKNGPNTSFEYKIESPHEIMDGKWWPRKSTFTGIDRKVLCVLEYSSVEFNRSDHAKKISGPEPLNAPIGCRLSAQWFERKDGFENCRYIGHGKYVTDDEWQKLKPSRNSDRGRSPAHRLGCGL